MLVTTHTSRACAYLRWFMFLLGLGIFVHVLVLLFVSLGGFTLLHSGKQITLIAFLIGG